MLKGLVDGPIFQIPMDEMNFRRVSGSVDQMFGTVVGLAAPMGVNLRETEFVVQKTWFYCWKNFKSMSPRQPNKLYKRPDLNLSLNQVKAKGMLWIEMGTSIMNKKNETSQLNMTTSQMGSKGSKSSKEWNLANKRANWAQRARAEFEIWTLMDSLRA